MKMAFAAAVVLALVAGWVTGQDLSPIRGAARVVSRVSYYSWEEPKGWVELEDRKTIVEEFGADGRIRSRELLYDGTLLEATTFSYSPAGVQKLTHDQNNQLLRKAEVKIVGGRMIETACAGDGATLFSSVIQTDLAGRTIEAERRDAQGVFVYRIRYLYDAKGNLLEAACLNPDGSTAFVSSFTYSDFNLRGAWRTRRESCSFADVKNRPREIIRRSIRAGGAS